MWSRSISSNFSMYRLSAWIDEGSGSNLTSRRVACEEEMIPLLRSSTMSKHAWTVSAVKPDLVAMGPVLDPVGQSDEVGN